MNHIMKSLAKFSVENSLMVNVMSVFFVVAGLMAIFSLNRDMFPNVELDRVVITTVYPGATPDEIEKLITIPIEDEIHSVNGIKEYTSVSAEGISTVLITLEENLTEKYKVVNDIQRAVDNTPDLPGDLPQQPVVKDLQTKDQPIIEISLSGDVDETTLREYAYALEKKIENFSDVSRVDLVGYRDREIWVEFSPQTLTDKYLSLQEVITSLARQNQTVPGGKIYENGHEFVLRTTSDFETVDDVKKTVVRAATFGKELLISDIAKVSDDFEEETTLQKTGGTRAISLTVVKKEAGDAITLVEEVKEFVTNYQKSVPSEIQFEFLNDRSFFIKRRLNVLTNNGIIGLAMVTISLFTFLSLGTALGAFLGIPTALLIAFFMMQVFGMTINLISMFGIIMVLGMLVDEDIVISENIYRHMEMGKSPARAAVDGTVEVAKALVGTVLTTIAAFIPLFFLTGTTGKFIRDIPKVVVITLAASLIEALIILPSHIADISEALQKSKDKKAPQKRKAHEFFDKFLASYQRFLKFALRRRYTFIISLFAIFIGCLFYAKNFMRYQMFPGRGVEIFFIRTELPLGNTLQQTNEKIAEIEALLNDMSDTELETYTTTVGQAREANNSQSYDRGTHLAEISVFLTKDEVRERSTEAIMDELREKTQNFSGYEEIAFKQFQHGPPVGSPVEIRITGPDANVLQKLSEKFKSTLETINGVQDITDDWDMGKDEKRVVVDSAKMAGAGLTLQDVALAVRQAFDGVTATKIKTTKEEIDVVVKFSHDYRNQPEALRDLVIPNQRSGLVRLGEIATFENDKGLTVIKHYNKERTITVNADIQENATSPFEVERTVMKKSASFMKDYPEYGAEFGGEAEESQESLNDLMRKFLLAMGLIMIILIAIFKSVIQPIIVILTIPFSIIGVIIAFILHGEPLSFMAVLGIVGLTGIVVDGAILMIDFINKHNEGDYEEAIISGASTRLRAVILTALTTILAIIPSVYGIGGSDPFIVPMAMSLNYGIAFSTVLTLVYVPLFIAVVHDLKQFLKNRKS
jgi:multidrug efflux pump subunit AcrB